MTGIADIGELRAAVESAADCGYMYHVSVNGRLLESLLNQLEAKRQRADGLQLALENEQKLSDSRFQETVDLHSQLDLMRIDLLDQLKTERRQREVAEITSESYKNILGVAIKELAALRGEQAPVGFTNDKGLEALSKGYMVTITPDDRLLSPVPLFTRQPKPVVVLPKIRDSKYWNGVEIRCDKYQLDVQATLEAAGIAVKGG